MIILLEKLVPHRSYRRSTDAPLIHNLNVVYAAFPVTNINTVSRIKKNKVLALKNVKMLENCSVGFTVACVSFISIKPFLSKLFQSDNNDMNTM